MKRFLQVVKVVLVVVTVIPMGSVFAQTPAKKSGPPVPVTYPGDTNETMARRVQWIEGAKKEGELVWWGIPAPAEAGKMIAEFNKLYPFIKVQYWRGEGEEVAAKIEAGNMADRCEVDITIGGEPVNFPRWRAKGIMEKIIDIVPKSGRDMLDKRMLGNYGDVIMPTFGPKSPQYNTKLVSGAEAPQNWEDVLNPKWKGQIGVVTDMKTFGTLALGEGGWGVEKMETFLGKLRQLNPIWSTGLPQGSALLATGEFKVLAAGNLRQVLLAQKKDAPVEWVRAKPMVLVGPHCVMLAKAPHPNAAKLFLEWLISPQGLQAYAVVTANYIPGTNTETDKLMRGLPVVVETEELILKKLELDLEKRFLSILGVQN